MRIPEAFRRLSLDAKLIATYLVVLGVGGVAISLVGSWIVSTTILSEAQRTVTHDLGLARLAWQQELGEVRTAVAVASASTASEDPAALARRLEAVREASGLDLVVATDAEGRVVARASGATLGERIAWSPIVAALGGEAAASPEVIAGDELARLAPELAVRTTIPRVPTAHAVSREGGAVRDVLALVGAAPRRGPDGALAGAIAGARLLNADERFVDRLWTHLYAHPGDEGGTLGTVTVFLGDVRVATTVREAGGRRALGTRVSDEVREAVLGRGETWRDRAFVVDDWYRTAYEPIRDGAGNTIGMLYVGLREASYVATRNRVIVSFFAIATVGFAIVIALTYRIMHRLTRPLREMAAATRRIAAGRFDQHVDVDTDGEIGTLAESFNAMQSSLRAMRHDLEEAARTLEDKVQARSEELAKMQARVAQSERLASIGMLAAGVAHEINNPLGGILALTALTLEDLPPDDPSRDNLEEVVRQTQRCSEIVKHLLEFSRQHQVSAEEVDVNRLLEKTLALLERQSIFFNVALEKRLAPDLPKIIADGSQLQQVFMNVVINGVQAMDHEGALTVTTRYDAPSDRVEIAFSDTGCGIPPDKIDHIFDPFFTTNRHGQGTGLGLSIAYGIVSRHHGTISVDSEVGRGTTFRIRLPATAGLRPDGREADELTTDPEALVG